MALATDVEIARRKINSKHSPDILKRYDYDVFFDKGEKGHACLYIANIAYIDFKIEALEAYDILSNIMASYNIDSPLERPLILTIPSDSLFGVIFSFYPNGEDDAVVETRERNGVGSALLERIIDDVLLEGGDSLIVETITTKSVKSFLDKKGFVPTYDGSGDYIKMLLK